MCVYGVGEVVNSAKEAGRYLETYKAYENKPADSLKEKVEQDFLSRVSSTGLCVWGRGGGEVVNSAEETGRYLETYKAYENKPADSLKEKGEQDFLSRVSSTGWGVCGEGFSKQCWRSREISWNLQGISE